VEGLRAAQQDKDFAWIAVPDRASRNGSVPVSAPPIAGLKLVSYADEVTDLGELGLYYYWSFIVQGGIDDVAQHLPTAGTTRTAAQRRWGIHPQRTQGRRPLASDQTPAGQAPGTRHVERVLIVEPEGKQGTQSRVSCSVQGGVDAALLALLRPDIAPVDYPRTVVEPSINDVEVPAGVLQHLDAPLLQPKFKTLTYTYRAKKGDGSPYSPTSVTLSADGGLLNKNEVYNSTFHVERQTKADLIQLKSKMNGIGDGRVLQTREVELNLPTSWTPGQTLSARLRMANMPENRTTGPSRPP
jgi:hypothetical protein